MKINVAHIVQSFDVGGIEKLVVDLIANSKDGRFQYTVFCIDSKGRLASLLEEKGVEVIELNKRKGVDISLIFRFADELKKRKIDVVHSHNPGPAFYGGLAARLSGISVIVYSKHGIKLGARLRDKFLESFSFMLQDYIVAVSEKAFGFMIDKEKAPAKKMLLIENGIDLNQFKTGDVKKETVLSEHGLPRLEYIIGIIARLDRLKDIPTLISAFGMLSKGRPDASLVVVGDGEERNALEKLVKETGLTGKVFFLGTQTRIPELLSIFSLFVLSSITESSPISLLEAMAAGLPIVATNVGGNAELVKDGYNGFIVEPKDIIGMRDAMLKIIEDKDLAKRMGEVNRKTAFSKYGIENTIKKYESLYVQGLERKAKI